MQKPRKQVFLLLFFLPFIMDVSNKNFERVKKSLIRSVVYLHASIAFAYCLARIKYFHLEIILSLVK